MPFVLAHAEKLRLLALLRPRLQTYLVCLYTNSVTPDPSGDATQFVEASFPGYARQPLPFPFPPFSTGGGRAELDSSALVFARTSGTGTVLVYGVFLLDGDGNWVGSAVRAAGSVAMSTPGATFVVSTAALLDLLPL